MTTSAHNALASYEPLGALYDELTSTHRYDLWMPILDELVRRTGPPGRRLLDVGCGTGKSALGMQALGYEVTGVDISPSLLSVARRKSGNSIALVEGDIRALPELGVFDIALACDDVFNHLLTQEDVLRTLASIRRQLAPGGLLVFDVNTLYAYRNWYATTEVVVDRPDTFLCWQGHASSRHPSGAEATATLHVATTAGADSWKKRKVSWRQRHHPSGELTESLRRLEYVVEDLVGLTQDGECHRPLREDLHNKAIWLARRP